MNENGKVLSKKTPKITFGVSNIFGFNFKTSNQ